MIFRNRRRDDRRIAPNTSPQHPSSPQTSFGMRLRRSKKQPSQQQQQQEQRAAPARRDPMNSRSRQPKKTSHKRRSKHRADSDLAMQEMNVNETNSGYEISLDTSVLQETREPTLRKMVNIISSTLSPSSKGSSIANSAVADTDRLERQSPMLDTIQEQLRQRQKIHRSQFSLDFPALAASARNASRQSSLATYANPAIEWRPKDHRIPLLGFTIPEPPYEDVFQLLRSANFADESKAVESELDEINHEIVALEDDRSWIETNWSNLIKATVFPNPASPSSVLPPRQNEKISSLDWDANRLLDCPHMLNAGEQVDLQNNRGLCFSVRIQNYKARESFLSMCGHRHHSHQTKMTKKLPFSTDVVTLSPETCRIGGAGAAVQHVSVLSAPASNPNSSAFFISRDNQKSTTWGHLPPKLFRRMRQEPDHDVADLEYLSTGPRGCYYAQFRSGECWWGIAVEDKDFHTIMKKWDVYRVVFGPIVVMEDTEGRQRMSNSWIILGRDGRVAWKNLPSRLHYRLESRLADRSAPAEVTLGPGDSYYIKFLDGTVDYCLPAMVARVCEYIELHGGTITNLSLHPENSHDFVIRHTEMR